LWHKLFWLCSIKPAMRAVGHEFNDSTEGQ
jgi:hypothetical protein